MTPGGAPGKRRLGLLAALAVVGLVLIGISSLAGRSNDDDGSLLTGDAATTTTAEGDDATTTTAEEDDGDDGFDYGTGPCPPAEKPEQPVRQFAAAPQRCLTDGVDYAAVITTNLGPVTIDLLEDEAPGTVNNFVVLARHGYYDETTFHRVIPEFVAQGGDPVGQPPGTGDPGYTIPDELPGSGAYQIGSVAMANAFDRASGRGRDTGGSQFFIVTGTTALSSLSPDYALFGQVTEGADVVADIDRRGSATGVPDEIVFVLTVDIVER